MWVLGLTFATGFALVFTSACALEPTFALSCSVVTHPDNMDARAMAQTNASAFITTIAGENYP